VIGGDGSTRTMVLDASQLAQHLAVSSGGSITIATSGGQVVVPASVATSNSSQGQNSGSTNAEFTGLNNLLY